MKAQFYIADTSYDCNAYGATAYQTGNCTGTASSTGGGSGGSVLTNTGFDVAVVVTVACAIAFAALVIRIWRRPAKQRG